MNKKLCGLHSALVEKYAKADFLKHNGCPTLPCDGPASVGSGRIRKNIFRVGSGRIKILFGSGRIKK